MSDIFRKRPYSVSCKDGAAGLMSLRKNSIKLIYGSPPYPNAERNYGVWTSDDYIKKMTPFIDGAKHALRADGFLVINVKANREKKTSLIAPRRSLVIEKLAILMEEHWGLYCVDIEIWVKSNPVPTGLRCACQDAYEQNLWFSVAPIWKINLDDIRKPYSNSSLATYKRYEYKPRANGLSYVRKNKKIRANPMGALPQNVIYGGVSFNKSLHQAVQPMYLPEKYIKACTNEGDIVVDPWLGSGTTGISAVTLGRKFIGFDIFQEYVDIAKQRLDSIEEKTIWVVV